MSATTADKAVPPAAAAPAAEHKRRLNRTPYLLLAPGVLWLVVFFLIPIFTAVSASVQTGSLDMGFDVTWDWSNYTTTFSQYSTEVWHSLEYSVICTVVCLVLGYPLAYFIAFRGGRWKNLLMALVIAPAFTSFLIRTIAWETILSDHGWVTRILSDTGISNLMVHLGLLTDPHQLLNTPFSVIFGMVYNFLPFTVLPLYTSLEKIDPRLHEAGSDLYCSGLKTWRHVTWPLSLPGVIAGTLLTFIPAVGDYINAYMLGGPNTHVIGTVIENEALRDVFGYPIASAMGVILTAGTLIIVLVYVKKAGSEDLL
ncbi:MAG TPA: ABC transporter permease [Actinospica sp.]|nr:ABC transporter permease [Actinospica sp.]